MSENNPNIGQIRTAAEAGDAKAQFQQGICCMKGAGVPQDTAKGVEWIRKSAENGFAEAQYALGLFYSEGKAGLKQDKPQSAQWFLKAAQQGHKDAQYSLGVICAFAYRQTGKETLKAQAAGWLGKAAAQGHARAGQALAQLNGSPSEEGAESAPAGEEEELDLEQLQKAAEAGDADACYRLGNYYFSLIGDEEDDAAAVKWHRKGAELGHPGSQLSLGLCNLVGYGLIPENQPEAVRWFQKAADQGYPEAQYYLGACYMGGMGVKKNKKEGQKWLGLALSRGYTPLEGEYCGPEDKWTKIMRHGKTVIVILWIIAVAAFIWWTTYKGK